MRFWRRFFFEWMYLHSPPWDSGIVPPELIEFVSNHPAGRAIDLGCGTGTNSIFLAKKGWQVTAVDFSWLAIYLAKRKSRAEGTKITFLRQDVTNLRGVNKSFDLVLDVGCFHGLSVIQKQRYIHQLRRLLAAQSYFLLYGFIESPPNSPAVRSDDLEGMKEFLEMIRQQPGKDRDRNSAWFVFRKKTRSQS